MSLFYYGQEGCPWFHRRPVTGLDIVANASMSACHISATMPSLTPTTGLPYVHRPAKAARHPRAPVRSPLRDPGELARRARELEAQGRKLIKLNIGNPGAFGFRAPEHLQRAIADDMGRTDPYTHQQGLPEAREAIAAAYARRQHPDAHPTGSLSATASAS